MEWECSCYHDDMRPEKPLCMLCQLFHLDEDLICPNLFCGGHYVNPDATGENVMFAGEERRA